MSFWDWMTGGSPKETNFNDSSFAGPSEDQKAGLESAAQGYAPGYQLGSRTGRGATDWSFGQSALRPDQTNLERVSEQRGNHLYGGSTGGTQAALDAARNNMQPWATGFGAMGTGFYDTGAAAAGRATPLAYGQLAAHNRDSTFARDAAKDLYDRAQQGPGPSAAQAQLDLSTAQGMRQQLAMAGSGRGAGGGASAFRQAAANQATMQGQANGQASLLRAQEEAAWKQQQANMIAQSAQLAQSQQASDLAAAGYRTGAEQQQMQMNDAAGLGYGQLALGAQQAGAETQLGTENLAHGINMGAMSGGMGYEQLLNQIYGIDKGAQMSQAQSDQAERAANMAMVGQGFATVGAFASDIRAKKDIKPADDEVAQTLRRLGVDQDHEQTHQPTMAERYSKATGIGTPYGMTRFDPESGINRNSTLKEDQAGQAWSSELATPSVPTARFADAPDAAADAARATSTSSYEYKDPARHGQGTFFGPMAQELEKTPAGASLVTKQADGTKAVDGGRAGLLALSATGSQQRKQDDFAARMAEADAKIAKLEAALGVDDEKKRKRAGFNVDLSSPDTASLDESARREGAYRP